MFTLKVTVILNFDLNTDKGHLLVLPNLPYKFEECRLWGYQADMHNLDVRAHQM